MSLCSASCKHYPGRGVEGGRDEASRHWDQPFGRTVSRLEFPVLLSPTPSNATIKEIVPHRARTDPATDQAGGVASEHLHVGMGECLGSKAMNEGLSLNQIPQWPEKFVKRLRDLGITTAEQVVSRGTMTKDLADYLNTSEDEVRRLVDLSRQRLSPDVAKMMSAAVDTTNMGLGKRKAGQVRKRKAGQVRYC